MVGLSRFIAVLLATAALATTGGVLFALIHGGTTVTRAVALGFWIAAAAVLIRLEYSRLGLQCAAVKQSEAVARSVEAVRSAAVAADRDPSTIRAYAAVVVAPDRTAHDTELAVNARGAGYFHVAGLGDALVAANQWDSADLARYRSHPTLTALGELQADKALSRAELVEVSHNLPADWLAIERFSIAIRKSGF